MTEFVRITTPEGEACIATSHIVAVNAGTRNGLMPHGYITMFDGSTFRFKSPTGAQDLIEILMADNQEP